MKLITITILTTTAVLFMSACGGSSGETTPAVVVNNEVIADGSNSYGYYGEDVIFGSSLISGEWKVSVPDNYCDIIGVSLCTYYTELTFEADGYGTPPYIEYGISKDGTTIGFIGGHTTITESIGNDCYIVEEYHDAISKAIGDIQLCRVGNIVN